MKRHAGRLAFLLILCMPLVLIGGCWGYQDVDELFIVMGGYLDKDHITHQYNLHIEIMKPQGGKDSKMVLQLASGKGDTVFAAIRDALIAAGGTLYWGHTQVWVVSRAVAEDGLLDSLDMISRGTEVRTDTNVLVYDGVAVEELIQAHSEKELHDSMSQHINDMINDFERSGTFVATPIWKVLGELSGPGVSLTMPLLEVYEDEGEMRTDVRGISLFKGDKMIGYIERKYGVFLYGYKGNISNGYILAVPETKEMPASTLEISSTKYTTKIKVHEKGLRAEVRCDIVADLAALQTMKDYLTVDTIVLIEREYERYIKEAFLEMVEEVQSKYGADIFGFGRQVHVQQPAYWKKVKEDWNAAFRSLDVDIETHVKIKMTGLAHEPLGAAGGE